MAMTFRILRALALVVPLLVSSAAMAVEFDRSTLVIDSESGRHEFSVELALTPEQRTQGLMYRKSMAPDGGMLFDFGTSPQRAAMWMRNTLIPLDMVFILPDGRVESIAERTIPQSLEVISSRGPVRGVLELNGGTASRLGIKPGDLVEHAIFGTAKQ